MLAKVTTADNIKPDCTYCGLGVVLDEFLQIGRRTINLSTGESVTSRRKEFRRALNDPSNGYTRFFKALRADQRRPTSVLKVGDKLTANFGDILKSFNDQWSGVYNRLEATPPQFAEFQQRYGEFMQNEPTGCLLPSGAELAATAKKARVDSAAGRDAWRPAELALLPIEAWDARAKVLALCAEVGHWPKAYREVSSPCLHKKDRLDPEAGRAPPTVLDHRLLSVYTQLYRIEMGAWCKNHTGWLARTVHPDCCGAMPGREPKEASWDALSEMAAVIDSGDDLVIAVLDYYKFFDSLEPRFYGKFLGAMGLHPSLTNLFLDLNTQTVRRVKIGGVYGEPFSTYNALGQGDPLTLVVALLYVSVQFKALDKVCPSLNKSAVVDDRNVRGSRHKVLRACRFIHEYDVVAGHLTNPKKMAMLASTTDGREWCRELELEGEKPRHWSEMYLS